MKTYSFIAKSNQVGERLDKFLLNQLNGISRSFIKNVIENEGVKVNGKIVKAGYFIKVNDQIDFYMPEPKVLEAVPEDIALDIVYEDDDIAVINKPQGMVVHPACGNEKGTLVNALLYNLNSLSTINGVIRPGIVHRLDKDTSGLLVVAKNDIAHRKLQNEIQKKEAKRFYMALVDGNMKADEGMINQPIGRSKTDRKKMAVVNNGRPAQTNYKVVERFGRYTLCEFELKTGRTHQIRVHSRYVGHPVVGDTTYGGSNPFNLKGQLLHAYKLILTHPTSDETVEFKVDLPEYFRYVLDILRK